MESTNTPTQEILIVDDEPVFRRLFRGKLEMAGFQVTEAETAAQAQKLIQEKNFDAIVLDQMLGDSHGLDLIPVINTQAPTTQIIMLTAFGNIEMAVEALNKGASGFLLKSDSIDKNIEKFCDLLSTHDDEPHELIDYSSYGLVGSSAAMQRLFRRIKKVAPVDSTVLICGESGTGKELIAQLIHKLSPRSQTGPFLAINCAAISPQLLEAELFGAKKGAFTDAKSDRKGFFEACQDGTLFLDEIAEMSPALQAKLLRALQEKEITPVGSVKPIKINARVVAATNKNLYAQMIAGNFREDLYYRLAVIRLDVPPLRERRADLEELCHYFIDKFNKRFNKNVRPLNTTVMSKIKSYAWPGNVRELHNAMERAVLLAENNQINLHDVFPPTEQETQHHYANNVSAESLLDTDADVKQKQAELRLPLSYQEAKEYFEKKYIIQLLKQTRGSISEAARLSGQYRPAIYRLINKHKIRVQDFR